MQLILKRLASSKLSTKIQLQSIKNSHRFTSLYKIGKCYQSSKKIFSNQFYNNQSQQVQLFSLVNQQKLSSQQNKLLSSRSFKQLFKQFDGKYIKSTNRYFSIFLKKYFQLGPQNTSKLKQNYDLLLNVTQYLRTQLFSLALTNHQILGIIIFFKKVKQIQNLMNLQQKFSLLEKKLTQYNLKGFERKLIVMFISQIKNSSYNLYEVALGYNSIKNLNKLDLELHAAFKQTLVNTIKQIRKNTNNTQKSQIYKNLVFKTSIIVLSEIYNQDYLRTNFQIGITQFIILYIAQEFNKNIDINHKFIDQFFSIYETIQLWKGLTFFDPTQFIRQIQKQLKSLIKLNQYLTDKIGKLLIKQIQKIEQKIDNIYFFERSRNQQEINLLNQQIIISMVKILPKSIFNISSSNVHKQLFQIILKKCYQFKTIDCKQIIQDCKLIKIPDLQNIKLPTYLKQPKNILTLIQSYFFPIMKSSQFLPQNQKKKLKKNFLNLFCFLPHYAILYDYSINKKIYKQTKQRLCIDSINNSVAKTLLKIFYQYLNGYKANFYKQFIITLEDWQKIFQCWIKLSEQNKTINWKAYFALSCAQFHLKGKNERKKQVQRINKIYLQIQNKIKNNLSKEKRKSNQNFYSKQQSLENIQNLQQCLKLYGLININMNQSSQNLIDTNLYIELEYEFQNWVKQKIQYVFQAIFCQTQCFDQKLTIKKIFNVQEIYNKIQKNQRNQKNFDFYIIFQQFLKNRNKLNVNQIKKSAQLLENILINKIQKFSISQFLIYIFQNPSFLTHSNLCLMWATAIDSIYLMYLMKILTKISQLKQYKFNKYLLYHDYQQLTSQQKSVSDTTQSLLCNLINKNFLAQLEKKQSQIERRTNMQVIFHVQSLSVVIKNIAIGKIVLLPKYLKLVYKSLLTLVLSCNSYQICFDLVSFIQIIYNFQSIGFQNETQYEQNKEQQYISQFFLSKKQIIYLYQKVLFDRKKNITQQILYQITLYRNQSNIYYQKLILCYLASYSKELNDFNSVFTNKQIFKYLQNLNIQFYQQVATILRYSNISSKKHQQIIRYIDQIANYKTKNQSFKGYDRRKIMLIIYSFNPLNLVLQSNTVVSQIKNHNNANLLLIFNSIKKMLKRGVQHSIINKIDEQKAKKRIQIIEKILKKQPNLITVNNKIRQKQPNQKQVKKVNKFIQKNIDIQLNKAFFKK